MGERSNGCGWIRAGVCSVRRWGGGVLVCRGFLSRDRSVVVGGERGG